MKKKTLIIIIAAVLVVIIAAVALFFATQNKTGNNDSSSNNISSSATESGEVVEGGKVELGKVEVAANNEFKVEVKVSENVGFVGYDMEFGFDAKAFSFVKCESGLLSPLTVSETADGTLAVVGVEDGDIKDNGTLFTLVFKAKEDAAKGKYEIKTTKAEFANWDEKTVKLQIGTGTITVK